MIPNFIKRFTIIAKWLGFVYVVLFLLRLAYGYAIVDAEINHDGTSDFFNGLSINRKNYASEKIGNKVGDKPNMAMNGNFATNQKFEKTANIKTKSTNFEKDELALRNKTKNFNAVIQYEQMLGQKGNRQVHMMIGINPELFDSFSSAMQKIGTVRAIEITKVDKTNEYRQLNAKKTSIEKTLQSLNDLKTKGGHIADFVALNDKILEIEAQAQELGVELGNFDTENEFCTVKLSLYEGFVKKPISIWQRLKVAFEWTTKYFSLLAIGILAASASIFFVLLIIEKMKVVVKVLKKWAE